jgi:hypothetical protein
MDGDRRDPPGVFAAAWEAAGAVVGEWAQRIGTATSEAMSKLASDPAIRAAFEASRPPFLRVRHDCQCQCAESHPDDPGVCDNDAVTTRRLTLDETGPVDVPLCAPCATAQGLAELARKRQ